MPEDDIVQLSDDDELYLDMPYGGLFGNSVKANVIEEIMADPFHDYRPRELEDLTGSSSTSIRGALSQLASMNIIIKDDSDRHRPIYRANPDSKRLVALTLLSYAYVDDRRNSNSMDNAIIDYCIKSNLWDNTMPRSSGRIIMYGRRRTVEEEVVILQGGDKTETMPILKERA